jgi:hypothetical protein
LRGGRSRLSCKRDADRAEQWALKLARKNENQRNRRAKKRRIDYYVSEAALAIINAQCKAEVGYDTSSVINRVVEDFASGPCAAAAKPH